VTLAWEGDSLATLRINRIYAAHKHFEFSHACLDSQYTTSVRIPSVSLNTQLSPARYETTAPECPDENVGTPIQSASGQTIIDNSNHLSDEVHDRY